MPARRPSGRPPFKPRFLVLVHHRREQAWLDLPARVGAKSADQFWDHVALNPGRPPEVNSSALLRGKAGQPIAPGFSRTIHYEISGAGRIDYQFNPRWIARKGGDPHAVVIVIRVALGSH